MDVPNVPGEKVEADRRLNFENLEMLLKALTPGRWILLKKLRTSALQPRSFLRRLKEQGYVSANCHLFLEYDSSFLLALRCCIAPQSPSA